MPDKEVEAFLENLQKRTGKKPIMIKENVPPGTPPPVGMQEEKPVVKEEILPDGTKRTVDPKTYARKRLKELRQEGGVVSETSRKGLEAKDTVFRQGIKTMVIEIDPTTGDKRYLFKPKRSGRRVDRPRRKVTTNREIMERIAQRMGDKSKLKDFVPAERGKVPPKNKGGE